MKTFELTLKGFDGGTDATDHLVKWISAPSEDALNAWIERYKLGEHLDGKPVLLEMQNLDFDDGVDVKVDNRGYTVAQKGEPIAQWISDSVAHR